MIELEGQVLGGLDEFMLRIGHLLVLCRVAHEVGGSWKRIHREAIEKFSQPVKVSADENSWVANYLAAKKLCAESGRLVAEPPSSETFRYPQLETYLGPGGERLVRNLNGTAVEVEWQDKSLAHPGVVSRVGALTWAAKTGSKTGLSHVCDWAQLLDLIDNTAQLTPIGRLLATITGAVNSSFELWNPYLLGAERIIFGYAYLQKDIDLTSRLIPLLSRAKAPLTKADCRSLFVEAIKSVVAESDTSRSIPSRSRFELFQQLRDLERAAAKAHVEINETSTAWHRTASRVETLTDLGLLEKGRANESERYQYVYYPTERLYYAAKTMLQARNGTEWLEDHLATAVLFDPHEAKADSIAICSLMSGLKQLIAALRLPTTLFPIDCLMLGLSFLNRGAGERVSLGELRRALEQLAVSHPDLARLARGREGTRAEYISLNLQKLGNA